MEIPMGIHMGIPMGILYIDEIISILRFVVFRIVVFTCLTSSQNVAHACSQMFSKVINSSQMFSKALKSSTTKTKQFEKVI